MRYHHQLLVLSLVLIFGLVGCLGDQNQAPTQPETSAVMGLSDKEADCDDCDIGCRVTGGANGMFEEDSYTCGGQAGANTALQPQPKGEWTHHQKSGPSGSFVFHGGTASAPEGTEIDYIRCHDPGFCDPARKAPAKQIDFWGVGTFKNIKGAPASIADHVVVGESLHLFRVSIDDAGEPGRANKMDTSNCPEDGFGLFGSTWYVDCDCPDFYRITIYEDYTDDQVIYEVYGYIKGGNFQIHPLTGYDRK